MALVSPRCIVFFSLQATVGVGCFGSISSGSFVRSVCRFSEKSGCCVTSSCFGSFIPFWVALSSVDSGLAAVLQALDPLLFGDVTAGGHSVLPTRSSFQEQIELLDVLTVEVSKNYNASWTKRESASSCELDGLSSQWWRSVLCLLRLLAMKATGRTLQGFICNFYVSCECLCKISSVILYIHI
uniref:Uncharacterized protein n=1 Tax=Arundo donax TaxID=35708 RepID=A0A0A9DEM4_ARUDO